MKPNQLLPRLKEPASFGSEDDLSPFVRRCLKLLPAVPARDVLDLASGFGRHGLYLAGLGDHVVAADIDESKLARSRDAWRARSHTSGTFLPLVVNAELPLPFPEEAFDLVLMVHYVSEQIVEAVGRALRVGGFLLFETFGGHGGNWQDLPFRGQIASQLSGFEVLALEEKSVRGVAEKVVVKVLAKKVIGACER